MVDWKERRDRRIVRGWSMVGRWKFLKRGFAVCGQRWAPTVSTDNDGKTRPEAQELMKDTDDFVAATRCF